LLLRIVLLSMNAYLDEPWSKSQVSAGPYRTRRSILRDLVIMLVSNAHGSQPKQITGRCLPRM